MSVLEVKGVSKSFDGEEIIRDITLTLKEGELVSILGVSGGGKTTLFNMISGLSMPDEGNIYLEGQDITGKPGNVSYMLQKDLLLPYKTVLDNTALPLIVKGEKKAEATRLMAVMSLGVKKDDSVTVTVEGEDEETAFEAVKKFFEENL